MHAWPRCSGRTARTRQVAVDRIAIIGLGLLGGSIGMALKASSLKDIEVVGYDLSWDAVQVAKRRGAVDRTERDLEAAVRTARLVIVAAPILAFPALFRAIAPHLVEGAVVTDIGSTKRQVLEWAAELLPPSISFVGGHPMAGKETPGIENASATLLNDATYCIVPAPGATSQAVELVVGLAACAGAKHYFIGAEEHDLLVAGVSHLPMVLSSALMFTTSRSPSWDEMGRLAGPGFRDVSRLASSGMDLKRGISMTNQQGLLYWLDTYLELLQGWRKALAEDADAFVDELNRAREAREAWVNRSDRSPDWVEDLPSPGQQMSEMLMGSRLANLMRKQEERLRETERNPRRD